MALKTENILIKKFEKYLENQLGKTNVDFDGDSAASIFEYLDEFEDFLKGEHVDLEDNSIFSEGFNVDSLNSLEITDGKFSVKEDDESLDAEYFAQILNNLVNDETFKTSFDANGDGLISKEEYDSILSIMNEDKNDSISMDEFIKTMFGVKNGKYKTTAPIQTPIETPQSTSSSSSYNSGGQTQTPDTQQNSTEKNLDTMTLDALNTELTTAKSSTASAKEALNGIINESGQEISAMKQQVEASYNDFQAYLKAADEKLSQDLDSKKADVDNQQNLLNSTDTEINNQKSIAMTAKGHYEAAETRITALNSQISQLQAQLQSNSSSDSSSSNNNDAINQKIAQIRAEISAQTAIRDEQKRIYEDAQKEEQRLTNEVRPQQQTQLDTYKAEMQELEQQAALLATSQNPDGTMQYPELAAKYEAYNQLKTGYETYKSQAKQAAQSAFDTALEYQNNVQTKIKEKQESDVKSTYSAGLVEKYTKDGVEYDVLAIPGFEDQNGVDAIDAFANQIRLKGLTNTGDYGTRQCQNYSCVYNDLILQRANSDLTSAFFNGTSRDHTAGKMGTSKDYNSRQYHAAIINESGKDGLDVVLNELEQGRPTMVSLWRSGGVHYGTCVGIRSGADRNNLQPSDFLIINSYNAQIQVGGEGNSFAGDLPVYFLTDGYRYENGDGGVQYYFS